MGENRYIMIGNEQLPLIMNDTWTNDRIDRWFGRLVDKINLLEQTIQDQQITIIKQENKIQTLEMTIKQNSTLTQSWASITSKNIKKSEDQLNVINTICVEQMEKKNKEKKVIIYGIPISDKDDESEKQIDDEVQVKEIIGNIESILNKDKSGKDKIKFSVKYTKRVRAVQNGNKVPPIIVECCKDEPQRNVLLSGVRLLKKTNNNLKGIYINPDLTEAERKLSYELRQERNKKNDELMAQTDYYYGIRNNRIVKILNKNAKPEILPRNK